jgi:pimeloyl-ACP methyl ester carboxylesterase
VISHRATGPGRDLGWLFFNGGGPEPQVSTFPATYSALPAAWQERYNVVTFDPRGMGYSTQVRCFPTEAAEEKAMGDLPDGFPVGREQEAAYERAFTKLDTACARDAGPLLDHDSTADVARDMNLLREAVGAPVLNYYGASYGLCGEASTKACAFSAGTAAATIAKWNTLLRLARRHPVDQYTYADVVGAASGLGLVDEWQDNAILLEQLWTAATGGTPAPASTPQPSAGPSYYAGPEQQLAIQCADSPNPRDLAAYAAAAAKNTFAPVAAAQDRYTGHGTGPPPAPSWWSATPATRGPRTRTR